MTDVTVLGDVNVDVLSSPIDSYPKRDGQILLPYMNFHVGGGANNFAFAMAKLGLKVRLIGLTGDDVFGDYVQKKIREYGIENKLNRRIGGRTGITLGVQFKEGSRSLMTFRGTNSELSIKDFKLEDIRGDALHIAGYNFLDALRKDTYRVVRCAKRKGMMVSLDPDIKSGLRFPIKDLKAVLKYVDVFLPDRAEGAALTGKGNEKSMIEALRRFGPKIVVLKRGERGCVGKNSKEEFKIKGIKVKVANTTGAGDAFNAAFIFKYLKTQDLKESCMFANAAAAMVVRTAGDNRFVTEAQVRRYLKRG